MAFRKTLIHRLFNMPRISTPSLTDCRVSSSSTCLFTFRSSNPDKTLVPDPGDKAFSRRFIHKKAAMCIPSLFLEKRSLQVGDKLRETLRGMDIVKDRIRLDGLKPPTILERLNLPEEQFSVEIEDARKFLRLAQLEIVKSKLRQIEKNWILKTEFVQICVEACSDTDHGVKFAKALDDSGTVIVLGNIVYIKPEQGDLKLCKEVTKAIRGLLPTPAAPSVHKNDPRRKEYAEMEKQKAAIEKKAESLVRRELWGGLGYMVLQTAGFIRLTFWELSWDVMEPICFYVTSIYFMAGYTFFLRTSKEPSFEGFFQSRFAAKQKRLMQMENFDAARYNKLRSIFDSSTLLEHAPMFDHSESMLTGTIGGH